MKILIADDDPVAQLYLEAALEDEGYDILTASDGKSALHLVEQGMAVTHLKVDSR